MPNGRCYFHGGATPTGPALPQFKHGRYSKHFPAGLAQRYAEALNDVPIRRIRDEIAATEARLTELFTRLSDTSLVAHQWDQAFLAIENAVNSGADRKQVAMMLTTLKGLTQQGVLSEDTWKEVYGLMELRRRQMETEAKIAQASDSHLTAEQAMALVSNVLYVLTKHIQDKVLLAAIGHDLRPLLLTPAEQPAVPVIALPAV